MRHSKLINGIVVIGLSCFIFPFQTLGAQTMHKPPKVIATSPKNGQKAVDSSLKTISVTFNKPMMDKSWSWTYKDKTKFPEMAGQPYYQSNYKINVLPVTLEPHKSYEIWINSTNFRNFKDQDGQASEPFKFTFETK